MNRTEEILLDKIKQSIEQADKETMIDFAVSLLDIVWNIPAEREKLIQGIEIGGIQTTTESVVKEKKPRKERAVRKPKKTIIRPKQMTDEQIAKAIADELKDADEEEIEVAEHEIKSEQDTEETEADVMMR